MTKNQSARGAVAFLPGHAPAAARTILASLAFALMLGFAPSSAFAQISASDAGVVDGGTAAPTPPQPPLAPSATAATVTALAQRLAAAEGALAECRARCRPGESPSSACPQVVVIINNLVAQVGTLSTEARSAFDMARAARRDARRAQATANTALDTARSAVEVNRVQDGAITRAQATADGASAAAVAAQATANTANTTADTALALANSQQPLLEDARSTNVRQDNSLTVLGRRINGQGTALTEIQTRLNNHNVGFVLTVDGGVVGQSPLAGAIGHVIWRTGGFYATGFGGGLHHWGLSAGTFVAGAGAGAAFMVGYHGRLDLGGYARTMQLPERQRTPSGQTVRSAGELFFEAGLAVRWFSNRRGSALVLGARLGVADLPGSDIAVVAGAEVGFAHNFGL